MIFVPETVAARWIYAELTGDAAVVTALGSTQVYPNVSPPETQGRHITHWFYGPSGGRRPTPLGRSVSQVGMTWHITAWEPSYSQLSLEPLMLAVMAQLVGPEGRGRTTRYVDTTGSYTMECEWAGPEYAKEEAQTVAMWAPLRHLYEITVRPVA